MGTADWQVLIPDHSDHPGCLRREATVGEIIGRVKLVNDDGPGLLRLDEQLRSSKADEDS
ncbi:MAG: hypothetical protein ACQEXN_17780 [Actinomycetota bacterium]